MRSLGQTLLYLTGVLARRGKNLDMWIDMPGEGTGVKRPRRTPHGGRGVMCLKISRNRNIL